MQQLNSIKDLQKIHISFNYVYDWLYEQRPGTVHTDHLFNTWAEEKKRFYSAWGDKLIWEYPKRVSFDLSEREREQRLTEFIGHVYDDLCCDLGKFLEDNKKGILENKMVSNQFVDVNGKPHTFPEHLKLSRAILQMASKEKLCEPAEAEYVRCRIAELIQETKITGKLCFSVHPLDYISISENQSNWRSCHALDGEFASGNLSYMLDPYTVVAYLRSDKPERLPRFPEDIPWNNKKWRMLLCFDNIHHMVWANRQYPFYSKSALDTIGEILNDHMHDWKFFDKSFDVADLLHIPRFCSNSFKSFKKNTANSDTFNLNETWMFWKGDICKVEELVGNESGSLNFNDLIDSSTYVPDYLSYDSYTELDRLRKYPKMLLGGVPHCIFCDNQPIAYTSIPLCPDCLQESKIETEYITYCSCCGKRILSEDAQYDCGDPYCDDCYARLYN